MIDLKAPISSIMTTNLVIITPEDNLLKVKKIFEEHAIHHIPVVHFRDLVGLISKSDFLLYSNSLGRGSDIMIQDDQKLEFTLVSQLMITKLGKLEPDDRIEVAIDVFLKNYFHCLPVVQGTELKGLVTPFDVLRYVGTSH